MKDVEMYDTICRDRFDKIESLQNETIGLLRGKNGDSGLLDDMRAIKKAYRMIMGVVVFVCGTVGVQLIQDILAWLKTTATP